MRYGSDQEQCYFENRAREWREPLARESIEEIDRFLEGEELDAEARLEARQEQVKHKDGQGFTLQIRECLPFTD